MSFTLNFNASVTIIGTLSGATWLPVGGGPSSTQWTTTSAPRSLVGFNRKTWTSNLISVVNIPSSVTRISNDAFNGCSGLSSITIPSSVTTIGNNAFNDCTSLSSITIPTSVTSIGDTAFAYCSGLSSVTFNSPSRVTTIGNNAFQGCTSLSSITIPPSVTSIGSVFGGCTSLSSITIPTSVTSIGITAFLGCTSLSSITIPPSVTSIGNAAFYICTSLSSVTFDSPSSVTSIGQDAFNTCTSLSSITIPPSVTSIGNTAFAYCTSLTSISVDLLNPSYANYNNDGVLYDLSINTLITYPQGNTSTSFTIPSSVTRISNDAFNGCSGLSSITIPSSVTSIGNNAFAYCSGLSSITIPTSVTSIGNNAFTGIANQATLYTSPTDTSNPVVVYFQSLITSGAIVVVKYPADPPPPPLVCFNSGTKIQTMKGYVPIETLRKGDLVNTLKDGYIPINMIGKREIENVICEERIKDKLYVCKQSEYPELFEDLVITGCHAILEDEFKNNEEREKSREVLGDIFVTDNKYRLPACVDSRASAYEKEGKFTIYHLALENDDSRMNYGIYANGLLVETCSKRYLKELSNMTLL